MIVLFGVIAAILTMIARHNGIVMNWLTYLGIAFVTELVVIGVSKLRKPSSSSSKNS